MLHDADFSGMRNTVLIGAAIGGVGGYVAKKSIAGLLVGAVIGGFIALPVRIAFENRNALANRILPKPRNPYPTGALMI